MTSTSTTRPRPLGPGSISVVGAHGGTVYGPDAQDALRHADIVVGSPRHLSESTLRIEQDQWPLSGPLAPIIERMSAAATGGARVCLISSGDPGFFGIVRLLGELLGAGRFVVHPAPSSVSIAFARAGMSWDDAAVVSAHGRPLCEAVDVALGRAKVAILTSPEQPPQSVGRALLGRGSAPRRVVVASRLGEPAETITHTDLEGLAAGTFDPMSVVLLIDEAPAEPMLSASLAWGLPETAYEHRAGMITKAEVRAVVISKLALPRSGVVWDVGAGSGSVAIECARLSNQLRVFAIERDTADSQQVMRNAKTHGVHVDVVNGSAPEALAGLPDPDRVFVGGGGLGVLDACLARLRPGGTIVATHVLVDRASEAWKRLGNSVQMSVSRSVAIADGMRLQAENPVFVSWGPA